MEHEIRPRVGPYLALAGNSALFAYFAITTAALIVAVASPVLGAIYFGLFLDFFSPAIATVVWFEANPAVAVLIFLGTVVAVAAGEMKVDISDEVLLP